MEAETENALLTCPLKLRAIPADCKSVCKCFICATGVIADVIWPAFGAVWSGLARLWAVFVFLVQSLRLQGCDFGPRFEAPRLWLSCPEVLGILRLLLACLPGTCACLPSRQACRLAGVLCKSKPHVKS